MHSQIADGTWKVAGLNPQINPHEQASFGAIHPYVHRKGNTSVRSIGSWNLFLELNCWCSCGFHGLILIVAGTEFGSMAMASLQCSRRLCKGFALSRSPAITASPELRRVSVSKRGILLPIRASSSGENMLPVDHNGVATLESFPYVSPAPTKDENSERLEALIERVLSLTPKL